MNFFKRRAEKAEKTYNAYRRLFSTEDGAVVLADLMRSCNFMDTVYGEDANETYFNEGKRSVLLAIMKTAKMSPEEVSRIVSSIKKEDMADFADDTFH